MWGCHAHRLCEPPSMCCSSTTNWLAGWSKVAQWHTCERQNMVSCTAATLTHQYCRYLYFKGVHRGKKGLLASEEHMAASTIEAAPDKSVQSTVTRNN